MLRILCLIACMLTSTAWASIIQVGELPDRFRIKNLVSHIDHESIAQAMEKERQLQKAMSLSKYGSPKYLELEKELNGLELSIAKFCDSFKHLTELKSEIKKEGFEPSMLGDEPRNLYYQLRDFTQEHCDFLKEHVPEDVITAEMWKDITYITNSIKCNTAKYSTSTGQLFEDWFYKDIIIAAKKMDLELKDGDTLVGVGNTPQFLMEAYNIHKTKNVNLVSIAISGWPGIFKRQFLQSMMTEQGLDNYRKYMVRVGLSANSIHEGTLYFLDIVGEGGGIEFIIEEFLRTFSKSEKIPDINIMSINSLKTGNRFRGKFFEIKNLNLDMSRLASALDKIGQEETHLRCSPDFPAWRWHNWVEPHMPSGDLAKVVIGNIRNPNEDPIILPYNKNLSEDTPKGIFVNINSWNWIRTVQAYTMRAEENINFKNWFDLNLKVEEILEDQSFEIIRSLISQINHPNTRDETLKKFEDIVLHYTLNKQIHSEGEASADIIGYIGSIFTNFANL